MKLLLGVLANGTSKGPEQLGMSFGQEEGQVAAALGCRGSVTGELAGQAGASSSRRGWARLGLWPKGSREPWKARARMRCVLAVF